MSPQRRRRGSEPPAPFVVGVGRSGTTLLRLMLDAHPQLAIPPETHFLPDLLERDGEDPKRLLATITQARTWGDFAIDAGQLGERVAALARPSAPAVARVFFELYAEGQDKPRWGDKTPGYVKRMRPIAAALGEARFVHLVRDGRDVALSRRARGMGAHKPLADTAELWRRRIENARRQARRLRGRYLELRFEDLVAEPQESLERVCRLVELDFDASMLSHHERAAGRLAELAGDLEAEGQRRARSGAERLGAHALASTPPDSERTGTWRERMSAAELAEFETVAGDLLAELGYDVASS